MPLGSLLGPLETLLEASGSQKPSKIESFLRFEEDAAFWFFEALDGPLGLILPPSWADLIPNWAPKWAP